MDTTINQRVQQLIQALGMKPNAFADSIEKTPTAIYTIVNGRNKPGYDILEAILKTYPSVNPGWLLTGSGKVFIEEQPQPMVQSESYLHEHLQALEQNFSRLAAQLEKKDQQLEAADKRAEGLQRTIDALMSRPATPVGNFLNDVAADRSVIRMHPATQQLVEAMEEVA